MIISGDQTRFRMGRAPQTLWALEPNSLTFVGWLLWVLGQETPMPRHLGGLGGLLFRSD